MAKNVAIIVPFTEQAKESGDTMQIFQQWGKKEMQQAISC